MNPAHGLRWVPKASTVEDTEGTEGELLLEWLCGTWKDQKGSSYKLRLDDNGAMSVRTTRPSGDVIRTVGLIRVDNSKRKRGVVWGKNGSSLYVLDKIADHTLRWRSNCSSSSFSWERLTDMGSDGDDDEDSTVAPPIVARRRMPEFAQRRAQLRRELQEKRCAHTKENIDNKLGTSTSVHMDKNIDKTVALKKLLGVGNCAKPNEPGIGRQQGQHLLKLIGSGSKSTAPDGTAIDDHSVASPLPSITNIGDQIGTGTGIDLESVRSLQREYYVDSNDAALTCENWGSLEAMMPTET